MRRSEASLRSNTRENSRTRDTAEDSREQKAPEADRSPKRVTSARLKKPKNAPRSQPALPRHPAALDQRTTAYLEPLTSIEGVESIVEDFQAWTNERDPHIDLSKVAEGSFGEVYRLKRKTEPSRTGILKLIPLRATKGIHAKKWTSIQDAANEVNFLSRMQSIDGFVNFRRAFVLCGRLPFSFIEAWNEYQQVNSEKCESPNPNNARTYLVKHLWLLLEMDDAGTDLDSFLTTINRPRFPIPWTWDIFWAVTLAIAKGEVASEFEHRDLHLGNICIKGSGAPLVPSTPNPPSTVVAATRHPTHQPPPLKLQQTSLSTTIIDYTLSRASFTETKPGIVYADLTDKASIFTGENDLQFDMYRRMREVLGGRWREGNSRTNVFWLFHLVEKLLGDDGVGWELKEEAADINRMRLILQEVRGALGRSTWSDDDDDDGEERWSSAEDVIRVAVEKGWIAEEEVQRGFG